MSKMRCICGDLISDAVYPCETEGYIIGQKSWEHGYERLSVEISEYIEAVKNNDVDSFLNDKFNNEYSQNVKHDEIISDLIAKNISNYEISIAECNGCGRLWVQSEPGKNEYTPYRPENNKYNKVCDAFEIKNV